MLAAFALQKTTPALSTLACFSHLCNTQAAVVSSRGEAAYLAHSHTKAALRS